MAHHGRWHLLQDLWLLRRWSHVSADSVRQGLLQSAGRFQFAVLVELLHDRIFGGVQSSRTVLQGCTAAGRQGCGVGDAAVVDFLATTASSATSAPASPGATPSSAAALHFLGVHCSLVLAWDFMPVFKFFGFCLAPHLRLARVVSCSHIRAVA